MNTSLYKTPLKLLAARILFIVVTYVFMVPMAFLTQWISWMGYSVLTAIPYLMLIFYDMRDAGHNEAKFGKAYYGFIYCLISQIPTFVILLLMLTPISYPVLDMIYRIWNAPFLYLLGGEGMSLYFTLPILLELMVAGISYILGFNNIEISFKKKN